MAERLGEALLDLRTNDAAFNAGIAQAEGRAQKLGSTLDRTSGSSAKLASEMVATGRSAQVMGAGFEQAGQRVVQSAGAQRAGMQQLSFQLNDIATMYALGARPMQIFASQSGQVIQSIQMMSGGTSRLAAFLGGPWGIAITSATVVLTPFIGKLFEGEKALEAVEVASSGLADAQGILGGVFDLTTGKMNAQTGAAIALARAKLKLAEVDARIAAGQARQTLEAASRRTVQVGEERRFTGDRTGSIIVPIRRPTVSADAARRALAGDTEGAGRLLNGALDRGETTLNRFREVAPAIANLEVQTENIGIFQEALRSLETGQLAPRFRNDRPDRKRPGPRGPDQADIDARFESDMVGVTQQILRARLQTATSAEERAELAARAVEWDRREALRQLATREELSATQRAELEAATNRLADAELEAIEFSKRAELARDAQALADERFRGEAEALQNAQALADTEAERKAIALRLLEAEERLERLRLSTIISAAETDEAERARAQQALDNLNANSEGRRAAVARQNETETERYLRGLNATPGMINEAIDGIKIDGLEALNDGLADAITGAQSLGDVFSRVADQIIADLLRIAIQQAIIKPLAGALFGGGGGGFLGGLFGGGGPSSSLLGSVDGLFGGAFAGLFAKGGTIPTGQFGIVGEEGPELAYAGPGGLGILSNSDSRKMLGGAGGPSIAIPITIDATGADAAAIARLNARLDQLRAELPARIVSTVQEARDRRVIR